MYILLLLITAFNFLILSLKNTFKSTRALIDDKTHRISRNSKIIDHRVTSVIAFEQNFSEQVQDENDEDVNTLIL